MECEKGSKSLEALWMLNVDWPIRRWACAWRWLPVCGSPWSIPWSLCPDWQSSFSPWGPCLILMWHYWFFAKRSHYCEFTLFHQRLKGLSPLFWGFSLACMPSCMQWGKMFGSWARHEYFMYSLATSLCCRRVVSSGSYRGTSSL